MHDTESNTQHLRRRQRADASIRLLVTEWSGMRAAGEDVPLWTRFDPVLRFPQLVSQLFVLAREASGWRFRLTGTSLRGALGNATGRTIDEVFPTQVAQPFMQRLDGIATTRKPMRAVHAATYDRVQHSVSVCLPFHRGDMLVTRIASAVFYLDDFAPQGPFLTSVTDVDRGALDLVE